MHAHKDSFVDLLAFHRTIIQAYQNWGDHYPAPPVQEECDRIVSFLQEVNTRWSTDFAQQFPGDDLEGLITAHLGLES